MPLLPGVTVVESARPDSLGFRPFLDVVIGNGITRVKSYERLALKT